MSLRACVLALALGTWSVIAADAAKTKPATKAPAPTPQTTVATSNAIPAELPVPQSVFGNPTKVADGRDPFYPHSLRPYHLPAAPSMPNAPAPVAIDLQLKGISNVNGLKLAVINNATLKEGEDGDVVTAAGKVRVSCIEIKVDTALVQVGTERRLLKLRTGA